MMLAADMTIGSHVQAVCGSRHRGPDARIVSPLPNVRLDRGAAAVQLVHHPLLEAMNGSGLTGSATLRVHGQCLHVLVAADRHVHIDLRRCPAGPDAGGDLLLVVTACGAACPGTLSSASFDLSVRARFQMLGQTELKQLPPCDLDTIKPAALQGLATRGWRAAPPLASTGDAQALPSDSDADPLPPTADMDDAYFLGRIKDEIGAALSANEPAIASRHVQIATLMARRLQHRAPASPVASRRAG